jgi:glycosyltransferase involved in cell wall biosynthesis
MNVLLVSNGFQPNYEKAFANGLAANGVSVVLVSSDRSVVAELAPSIEVLNLRGSQNPRRSRWAKAANMVRYACELVRHIRGGRYDVVHLTGMYMTRSLLAGCVEWAAYRLFARSFFMTVHNVLPHGRHGWWPRVVHPIINRLPHRLVVHTARMRTDLVGRFGIAENRIVVMAHGVDAVPPRLVVPPTSGRLRVLLFGGLVRYKGADLLLSAAARCQETPMDIILAGEARDAAYARELEGLIAQLGDQQHVNWKQGFVPEADVASYFESSDVAILPYRHIDQSGVLFTAFRFGCPVIATDVGAFRDRVPEFAGVIVDDASEAALVAGLRRFNEQRDAFDRRRIRDYAQSLDWKYCVLPLITTYAQAVS